MSAGEPLRIAVLGSTGSIGRQTLDVVARFPDRLQVVALAANRSTELLAAQARAHGVSRLALSDRTAVLDSADLPGGSRLEIGADAVAALAQLPEVDVVVNALVGAAGLRASAAALSAGKRLALANKESLVVGGDLLMPMAGGAMAPQARLLPVDSEHSAIFQCLVGEQMEDLRRIWLTASGGPFRGWDRERLASVTAEQALAHPTWSMGPKITIDSATLMNKGLEMIEAHHLFGVEYDQIRVIVHPQSCVHSMVEFADGSVKAHLGATDMRIPIQYALSYPVRWQGPVEPVDFAALGHLDFEEPDPETFGCLALAVRAGREGGTAPAALNAANEVAVAAFLEGHIGFTDIERVVASVLDGHRSEPVASLDQLETIDGRARTEALEAVADL